MALCSRADMANLQMYAGSEVRKSYVVAILSVQTAFKWIESGYGGPGLNPEI